MSILHLKEKFEELKKKFSENKNDEIIKECKNILKENKIDVFYNLLCLAYNNKGETYKSIEVMKEALNYNPKNTDFYNNIGMSYANIYKYKKAEAFYKKGLEIDQNNLEILNNFGNLKKSLYKSEEAVDIFKKILSIQSNAITVIYNLALLYSQMGRFEESKELLEKMLSIKPELTMADRMISQTTKYDANHRHFLNIKKKLSNKKLDDNSLLHLHYALGKAYNDQKKFKESFDHYKKANYLSKKLSKYNFENDKKKFTLIKDKFCSLSKVQLNTNSRSFLFIIGLPRSGTSLTEQILSSHKNVFGGGELPYLEKIFKKYIEVKENIDENDLLKCEKDYVEFTSNLDDSNKFFIDKAPLNFFYLGFILKFLPNSKFINLIRNPVDNCWSMYKNCFPTKINFADDLKDLVKYYKEYQSLMNFWKKFFPNHIYDLKYENLVSNTKIEVEKLLKFCSLDWDENCLSHHKNKRAIKTISFNQARKPIYKTSVKSFSGYENYLEPLNELI